MPKSIEIKSLQKALFAKTTDFSLKLENFLHPAEIKGFEALKDTKIKKEEIVLFYPGSANDTIMPTLMLVALADFKKAKIVLADPETELDFAAGLFQQLTDCRKFRKKNNSCTFYFNDKTFEIGCHKYDVLQSLPIEKIDIYFERAFQVFRQGSPEFFPMIKSKLADDALVITDFGDILDMEIIKTPEEAKALGFYKNFSVFTKSRRKDSLPRAH
ncbi:hypothetical protein KY329_00770 [Candidatus Woesearchaeota archaeon]|nr:hypothetical protein [Candidatus Woesearchaeota archaeon]